LTTIQKLLIITPQNKNSSLKKAMESLHFDQNEEGLRIPSLLTPLLGQKPLVTTKKSHQGGVA
jgi:hypothetical protein